MRRVAIVALFLLCACTWHEPKPEFEALKVQAEDEKWAKLDVSRYSEFVLSVSMVDGVQYKGPFHDVFAAGPGFVCPGSNVKVCWLSPDTHEVTIYHKWEKGSHRVRPSEPRPGTADAAEVACFALLALCVGAAIVVGAFDDTTEECEAKIRFTPAADRYYGVDVDETAGNDSVLVRIIDVRSGDVAAVGSCE